MKNDFILRLLITICIIALHGLGAHAQEQLGKPKSRTYIDVGFGYQQGLGKYSIKEHKLSNDYTAFNLRLSLMREMGQTRNLTMGLGIGLRGFRSPVANTFPVSLIFQTKPFHNNINIKVLFAFGYSFGFGDTFEKGFLSNAGLQWNPQLGKKRRLGVNVGYALQQLEDRTLVIFTPSEILRLQDNVLINLIYFGLSYRIF